VPYQDWPEFSRQQMSLWGQWHAKAQPQHSLYAAHLRFLQQDAANIFQPANLPWIQVIGGVTQINAAGIDPELEEGVQRFGALLEGFLLYRPQVLTKSAVATVVYDNNRDRLYYGVSGYYAQLLTMQIHQTLQGRIGQLPVQPMGNDVQVNSAVPGGRLPQVCSEFKALNRALNDGAQEDDLSCWSFRVREMTPMPQCPNCRVTVDRNVLARVWTG
jgi:hypothetical protein